MRLHWITFYGLCGTVLLAGNPKVKTQDSPVDREALAAVGVTPKAEGAQQVALEAAEDLKNLLPGTAIYSVKPNGNENALFQSTCLLLTEPAAYADLKLGDVVVLAGEQTGSRVVHRILARRKDGNWTVADRKADGGVLTPQNYLGRVFGVLYTDLAPQKTMTVAAVKTEVQQAAAR